MEDIIFQICPAAGECPSSVFLPIYNLTLSRTRWKELRCLPEYNCSVSLHLLGALADSSARNTNSAASRLTAPRGKRQLPTSRSPKQLAHMTGCSSHSNHTHGQSFPRDRRDFRTNSMQQQSQCRRAFFT